MAVPLAVFRLGTSLGMFGLIDTVYQHNALGIGQFATPGLYTLYARYSFFDHQDNSNGAKNYDNEDSLFLPLDFNEPAIQEGRFDVDKHGHNDPLEDPPYWEGQFHWTPDEAATWEDGSPAEYNVSAGEVGVVLDFTVGTRERGVALDVLVFSLEGFLLQEDLDKLLEDHQGPGGSALQAGDADQDLDFDQLDLVKVQVAAKYLTGQPATWGDGDWDAAPGGEQGSPPPGNGLFDQLDIIAALANGLSLRGPYAAIQPGGKTDDDQTSVGYNVGTGEIFVDVPAGKELTSINGDLGAVDLIYIPEPSTMALLILGIAGTLAMRRRRWS